MSRFCVGMCPGRTKSRPITRAKFFIQKPPKTYQIDTNLLIFLDLTYNPGKNFKFYSLQEQNFKNFLIFTYNLCKVFLILPSTQGGGGGAHVYLVSTGSPPSHSGSLMSEPLRLGGGHSITRHAGGRLAQRSESKTPKNIYPKIAILRNAKIIPPKYF